MKRLSAIASAIGISALAHLSAEMDSSFTTKSVRYEIDGIAFESAIVHQADSDQPRPGLLMIPNWMGVTDRAIAKAQRAAGDRYVVMVVDMYGADTRPSNAQEAGAAAGKVRADRSVMRLRAQKALDLFKSEGESVGLDSDHIAAIGFCFGGGAALELGRSGAELDAIVSFHGDLLSPTLEEDANQTTAKVLVLHGADDPYVPQDHVATFIGAMQRTEVDWQLVQYSGAVHSFTDPTANSEGSRYDETVASRAFQSMHALLSEIWPPR